MQWELIRVRYFSHPGKNTSLGAIIGLIVGAGGMALLRRRKK